MKPKVTHVQTIIFDRTLWTKEQAINWLKKHKNFKFYKIDTKPGHFRFRQLDPSKFISGSFRTISFSSSGIKAVVGHLK